MNQVFSSYWQIFALVVLVSGLVGSIEGKSFYENVTPDGNHHVQAFDKDYYVSWLDWEVDTNLVVAVTAFLITLVLLAINAVYPLANIRLPLLDSSRSSRHLIDVSWTNLMRKLF